MKKYFAALLLLFSGMVLSGAEWNVANSAIKVAKPDNAVQKLAAEELQKHLEIVAGKKLAPDGNAFTFHIGTRAPNGKKVSTVTEANYAIIKNNVYFWGMDKVPRQVEADRCNWLDSRNTSSGTMSAVYNFLENELGILWLRPGDSGIVAGKREKLLLPDNKFHHWVMPLEMTGVRTYFWRYRLMKNAVAAAPEIFRMTEDQINARQFQDKLYARRQRHGMHFYFKYGHAFAKWWDKYGKDHPEWFGMDTTGRRGLDLAYRGREKLCLSNPEVIEAIAREYIAAGRPAYYNVCPNDGTPGFCRCANCMKLDTRTPGEDFYAHLTDRYLWFWNKLTARLMKERKDVTIITYIYSYYRHPPRREKVEFPDNMLFGMVPNMFDDNVKFFSLWKKAGAKRIFLRPNDLCHGTPMPRGLEKRIYDKFQQARTFNIFGTDYDGGFGNRSIDLECYVAFRMVHDPALSFDAIMKEYCSAFGAAAPEVAEFYAAWRQQGEKIIPMVDEWLKQRNRFLNDAGQIPGVVNVDITRYYPDAIFALTDGILQRGLKKSLAPAERSRLENLLIRNRHAALYRTFIAEANKANAKQPNDLEAAARALYDFRVKYVSELDTSLFSCFGGERGEALIWQQVKWYRKDILKLADSPGVEVLLESNFARPDGMRSWKKRDAFIAHDHMTGTGVTLKTAPKVDTLALNYRNISLVPGKKYILSGEVRVPQGAKSIRFRIASGKSVNKYIYFKNGEAEKFSWEFTAPPGKGATKLYVYSGPGDGTPVFLRSLKLTGKTEQTSVSAPGVVLKADLTTAAGVRRFKKRDGFVNVSSQGVAIKTSATRDDTMALSCNIKVTPGKSYQLEAECAYSEGGTYVRFRFAGIGRQGNLYARSADGKPVSFKGKFTVPATFKGSSIGLYLCGSPGSGKPVFVKKLTLTELDGKGK